jgi:catechol 2,3-dioxygenase-like lactoylglutathione lyase family enzyme
MSERGRLPRVYADHVAQTVVMARAAIEVDPEVLAVGPVLRVSDLPSTLDLLQSVLRLHLAWAVPDPPTVAFLAVQPWSGSPGLQITQTADPVVATSVSIDVGVAVDVVADRIAAAGLELVAAPRDQPWFRRELTFRLPDGHLVDVSGPTRPPRLA